MIAFSIVLIIDSKMIFYEIVGAEAFALLPNVMRLYSGPQTRKNKADRGRHVSENAFEIMTKKFWNFFEKV